MVDNQETHLDLVFHALSDPTRRAMLKHLTQGDCNVSELPNPYNISKAAISKHLNVLHQAKLVEKNKDGRTTHCVAQLESFGKAQQLLEELGSFWRSRLDSLEQFFNENQIKEKEDERQHKNISKSRSKKGHSR